jgi:hypothetical protein
MSNQYPIHGNLATAEYSATVNERAKSLGMPVEKVLALMNVGYGTPPVDENYFQKVASNPNRNLFKTQNSQTWYVAWVIDGKKTFRKLSKDIEEARRMRDALFLEIGYKPRTK